MPKLSPVRADWPVLPLCLASRGKVRDSYLTPDGYRLIVTSNGISARDYVLNALIPWKGPVLNALTVFWFKILETYGIKHHMVAYGSAIDKYVPEQQRGCVDLQSRSMVVLNCKPDNAEFVVRGCLAGSAVGPYMKTGEVCGNKLPPGFQEGDEFPCALFTPTTKAQEGHDENVSAEEIIRRYPMASFLSIKAFDIARAFAKTRGIVIADTKFEWSGHVLIDEFGTPDSSRYWPLNEWLEGRKKANGRKAPGSFDKDPVRAWLDVQIAAWLKEHGIDKMDPGKSRTR